MRKKPAKVCVNAEFVVADVYSKGNNRHSDAFSSKLRGYEQKLDIRPVQIAQFVNPFVRGWVNYFAKFYPSALTPVLRSLERSLVYWVRRKFKRFRYHQRQAVHWLGRVARKEPDLFVLWSHGIRPATGQ